MVHSHSHSHGAAGAHHHAPDTPHPAQPATLSLLRMTLAERLGLAILLSAGLWALVWLATGPA
ncbi:MAG: hypothetical protein M9932_19410 [Xanthobacteraceae bacterium]|nr:hypothetical protein [Xanthobacteraceae bacterium]